MNHLFLGQDQFSMWDRFVQSHEDGTIFHGTDWKTVLENSFPQISGQILALVDPHDGVIQAGMPLYFVKSSLLGNRLVCTPFSTYCNPLVSNQSQLEHLLQAAERLAVSLSCKRIVVRMLNRKKLNPPPYWGQEVQWKHHELRIDTQPDVLWEKLHRNVKRRVRKSEKNNVSIEADNSSAGMEVFYESLLESRKRLGLPMIPFSYFASILKFIPEDQRCLLIAYYKNKPICTCLNYLKNGTFHLELSGEQRESRSYGAMQMLTWKALLNAREKGCSRFSFGRTSLDNHGLAQYKLRWATDEEDLIVFQWNSSQAIAPNPKLFALQSVVKGINKILPRPLYKRFGTFIYRHLG